MSSLERVTGRTIEQQIIQSIENGLYAGGVQLPSVREMADELGVNKNTIVRVYQSLHQQGYVQVVHGSGTFVRVDDSFADAERAEQLWQDKLEDAFRRARGAGLSKMKVTRTTLDIIKRVFPDGELRILFIECNQYDIDSLSDILSNAIKRPIDGLLVTDFLEDPESYIANADIIITTFFHLNEVEPLMNVPDKNRPDKNIGDKNGVDKNIGAQNKTDRPKLIAVHAMPTHDALLEIARLQVPVLGVVADLPRAMDMMLHIVQTYQRTATIMTSSLEDSVRLQNLLDKADAIAVTQSRYPGLMAHNPQIPVVPISLTISQESIENLQQHLVPLLQPT